MSNYEELDGWGRTTPANLRKLRQELIEVHNKQISHLTPERMKQLNIQKATTRTKSFPFLTGHGETLCDEGSVTLDIKSGEFTFGILENNHAVEIVGRDSEVYKKLGKFIKDMPVKGSKYGAETWYSSENTRDDKVTIYYGGWITPQERERAAKMKKLYGYSW